MNDIDELFTATPIERVALFRALGHRIHRGDPRPWALAGFVREMKRQANRTPTHRGEARNA